MLYALYAPTNVIPGTCVIPCLVCIRGLTSAVFFLARRYGKVDVFVDTHIYTAHSTASDALYAGVPVVTLASGSFQVQVDGGFPRCPLWGCLYICRVPASPHSGPCGDLGVERSWPQRAHNALLSGRQFCCPGCRNWRLDLSQLAVGFFRDDHSLRRAHCVGVREHSASAICVPGHWRPLPQPPSHGSVTVDCSLLGCSDRVPVQCGATTYPSAAPCQRLVAPLFDFRSTARNIERAYAAMWDVRLTQVAASAHRGGSGTACSSVSPQREYRMCLLGWVPMHIVVDPMRRRRPVLPPEAGVIDSQLLLRSEDELRSALVAVKVSTSLGCFLSLWTLTQEQMLNVHRWMPFVYMAG